MKVDKNKNRQEFLAVRVELNKRVSLPVACLAFVFLGLGLGWRRCPGGRAGGYGISLVVLVLYYVLLVFGQTRAEAGQLSPFVGLWLPDFVALAAGWLAYYSASQELEAGLLSLVSSRKAVYKKLAGPLSAHPSRSSKRTGRGAFRLTFHDRYILNKFIKLYIYIFLALVLVMSVFNFLTRWEMARESQQPVYLLFSFIWYKLPEFATQAIQLAVLIAPVLCLNFLYRRNEIQTMVTSGLSYWRIVVPVLVIAVLLIPLSFFLQDRLVVRGNFEAERIWSQLADRPIRAFTYHNRYWIKNDDLPGFVHYELSSPDENSVQRLLIFQTEKESFRLKRVIFSQVAKVGQNNLRLENGWERDIRNENFPFSKFDSFELNLPEAQKQFIKEWKEPALMTLSELHHYSRDLERSGSPAHSFKLEAEARLAFSFSVFVLALLVTALAGLSQKKPFPLPLGLALGVGYLFWQTTAIFRSLGQVGILSAELAAWSPQIIFSLIGFYLFFRVKT